MQIEVDTNETPQRDPLSFDINVDAIPEEYRHLASTIKQVAEQALFRWKTFPIVLPPPLLSLQNVDACRKKTIGLCDVFISPMFDELDSVALNSKGETPKLSYKQLKGIREWGEFEVESLNFPGQRHRWRLSRLLQKGTCQADQSLLNDVALALRFVLVMGWNRFTSHFFSIFTSVSALVQGSLQFTDALVGMPALLSEDLDAKMQDERSKHLVAELIVPSHLDEDLDLFCQFIKRQIHKQKMEKYRIEHETIPSFPYLYQTPKGALIDLRLFNKLLIKKLMPILSSILERRSRGWFRQFEEKLVTSLKSKGFSDEEIKRRATVAVMDEYMNRVSEVIRTNSDIESIGQEGIGNLLVEQAYTIILMYRAIDNLQLSLKLSRTQLQRHLEATHPILSRIGPWLRKKLRQSEEKYLAENKWSAHEEAYALCKEHNLQQMAYFLHRDLVFMREREPILLKELSRVRTPMRLFRWRASIWFSKNWIVKKVYQGESVVVPTVLVESGIATSSTCRPDPDKPVYLVERQVTYNTSTRWPFWRWVNYVQRTRAWLWNVMFLFGVVIPWCSPFGLRALLAVSPFMPDLEPGEDGSLVPRRASLTPTVCSRLVSLWRHISKSRTEFESQLDRGFIGKSLTRHMNRAWNYLVKGTFGTFVVAVLLPLVCIVVSLLSICAALTAFLWLPIATLFFYLFCFVVYDFDCPDPSHNRWFIVLDSLVWKILIQGCVQPVCALIMSLLICPVLCILILTFGLFRRGARAVWDAAMYHTIIKKRGRVPAGDSMLVRRVQGPGLNTNYYYQMRSEQALAALEAKMELDELNAYRDEVERLIRKPQMLYSEFAKVCFQPFSAVLIKEGVYSQLVKEGDDLLAEVVEKVDRRKKYLHLDLGITIRSKIRMLPHGLKETVKVATELVEKFYPLRVFPRLGDRGEEEFWERHSVSVRDWQGLAMQLLKEIFSHDILVPLDDADVTFHLGIQNVDLSRYMVLLQSAATVESTADCTIQALTFDKGNLHIHFPHLDVQFFNPLWKREATVRKRTKERNKLLAPWKKSRKRTYAAEWLKVPLPIPHPVEIAVIIHNREAENLIYLGGEAGKTIVGVVEDAVIISDFAVEGETLPIGCRQQQIVVSEYSDINLSGCNSIEGDSEDISSRSNRGSVVVNLASSEDITLEPDGERVIYSHNFYGTNV